MLVRPTKKRLKNLLYKIDKHKLSVFRSNRRHIFLYGYSHVRNNNAYLKGLYNKADKEAFRLVRYYRAKEQKKKNCEIKDSVDNYIKHCKKR